MHIVILSLMLLGLWLLLSTHFEPLMIAFGVVSVIVSLFVSKRLGVIDKTGYPFLFILKILKYNLWLMYQICLSNIDVSMRILGFKPIQSRLIRIPFTYTDDLSKVIYANSITLTPGSASILIEDNELIVHTVSDESAEDLFSGEMANLIPQTTRSSKDA